SHKTNTFSQFRNRATGYETQASREMAKQLRDNLGLTEDDVSIPIQGIGAASYRDKTWQMLNDHDVDSFVVILDEIDKLENNEILRSLSRARESGKSDSYIGIICISNKIKYKERLNERLDSSLQENELVFHPYDATQLRQILQNRRDAFKDGVLEDSVIPKAAALAAREHGDARKAVDALYEAGRSAEKEDDDVVTETHVDNALKKAEVNRFEELISGSTTHVRYILRALALLTESEDSNSFRTHEVYRFYDQLATKEGSDPLSEDRMRRLLKEQAFLGITEAEHTGGGHGEGAYLEHRLLAEPAVVIEALNQAKAGKSATHD
ncbi:MAG: Cdc6/Cdc18 family protein, partial [Halorientalis sp.]